MALPDFQQERLATMGFAEFLSIGVSRFDTPLLYTLHNRLVPVSHMFLFSWGHMVPTLEGVAQITGLCVRGSLVSRSTYPNCREMAQELLGLELLHPERQSMTLTRTRLQDSLGLRRVGITTGELPK